MSHSTQANAPIEFYDRSTGQVAIEEIYGEGFLRWAYGNPLGRLSVAVAVKRLWFSRWYGWRMDQPKSREKVQAFIDTYGVDPGEFAPPGFFLGNTVFVAVLSRISKYMSLWLDTGEKKH